MLSLVQKFQRFVRLVVRKLCAVNRLLTEPLALTLLESFR